MNSQTQPHTQKLRGISIGATIMEEVSKLPPPQPMACLQNLNWPMRSKCLSPLAANQCLFPAVTIHHFKTPPQDGAQQSLHQQMNCLISPQMPPMKLKNQPIRKKKLRVQQTTRLTQGFMQLIKKKIPLQKQRQNRNLCPNHRLRTSLPPKLDRLG